MITLLTSKVADEVGKSIDYVNQVDEVNPDRTESDRFQQVILAIFSYNFCQKSNEIHKITNFVV